MKYFLSIFFTYNTYSCVSYEVAPYLEGVTSVVEDSIKILKNTTCENFDKYKGGSSADGTKYKENIQSGLRNQSSYLFNNKNRHQIGTKLAQCNPEKNTKALVITFAGTGAYNPRAHNFMAELIQCKPFQHMPYKYKKNSHWPIMKYLKDTNSIFQNKYDMVASGTLAFFLKDNELNQVARSFKFASFASEEVEVLGDQSGLRDFIVGGALGDFPEGSFGTPGINNALNCVKIFFNQADKMNISPRPKLIVMGHSSGCRSSVKFLDALSKKDYSEKASLVVTLDPVEEAHTVAIKNLKRTISSFANPFSSEERTVKSRKQPKKLYKTNSDRWISFYQQDDQVGLAEQKTDTLAFGIHGSPMADADENIEISGLGDKGHGTITKKLEVNKKIKKEILKIFK